MPAKGASARATARVVSKSISVTGGEPDAKKSRLSKLEAKRLASFKALIAKYEGKCTFAGCDE